MGYENGENVRFIVEGSYFRLLSGREVDGLGIGLFQLGAGLKFRIFKR